MVEELIYRRCKRFKYTVKVIIESKTMTELHDKSFEGLGQNIHLGHKSPEITSRKLSPPQALFPGKLQSDIVAGANLRRKLETKSLPYVENREYVSKIWNPIKSCLNIVHHQLKLIFQESWITFGLPDKKLNRNTAILFKFQVIFQNRNWFTTTYSRALPSLKFTPTMSATCVAKWQEHCTGIAKA